MKTVEFKKWTPSADNPRQMEYVGQRTAQEVFEELKHHLEGMVLFFNKNKTKSKTVQ